MLCRRVSPLCHLRQTLQCRGRALHGSHVSSAPKSQNRCDLRGDPNPPPPPPLSPPRALAYVLDMLDGQSDAEQTTPPFLSRCIEAIHPQHRQPSQGACPRTDKQDHDNQTHLSSSVCIAVMQRTLWDRAQRASSISAASAFGVHHILRGRPADDRDRCTTRGVADTDKTLTWTDALRADSTSAVLSALEAPLISVVCASLRDFICQAPRAPTTVFDQMDADAKATEDQEEGEAASMAREDVTCACATLLLYTSKSSFPDAAGRADEVLKHCVRPALQRVFQDITTPAGLFASTINSTSTEASRRELAQQWVYLTELLLRVGPSLSGHTPHSASVAMRVDSASAEEEEEEAEAGHRTGTVASAQDLLHRNVQQHTHAYHACLRARLAPPCSQTPINVQELLWHTRLIVLWVARLPVGVDMSTTAPVSWLPVDLMLQCALDMATVVWSRVSPSRTSPTSSTSRPPLWDCDDAAVTAAQLYPILVQVGYSAVLHATLTEAHTDRATSDHLRRACEFAQRSVKLIECLCADDHPALLGHLRVDAETVWVQLAAVLHFLSCHERTATMCLVALQARLLRDGLARVLPTRTRFEPDSGCSADAASLSPVFLLSFLRAWTTWMPFLLVAADHHQLSASQEEETSAPPRPFPSLPPSPLADLMQTLTRENQRGLCATAQRRTRRADLQADEARGFPVLPRWAAAASHRRTPAESPPTSPPSSSRSPPPPSAAAAARRTAQTRASPFVVQLENALATHWIGTRHRNRLTTTEFTALDEWELFGHLHVLAQIRTHRALVTCLSDTDRDAYSKAAAYEAWVPSRRCTTRLAQHTMNLVTTSLVTMMPRRTDEVGTRTRAPRIAFTPHAFHSAHVDTLPGAGDCITVMSTLDAADDEPIDAVCYHATASWPLSEGGTAQTLRVLLHMLRPPTATAALAVSDVQVQQDRLAACRARGVHTDAFLSGLYRTATETWSWCLVYAGGRLVDPTCAEHVLVSTALLWQHWDHLPASAHSRCRLWHAAHRRRQRVVPSLHGVVPVPELVPLSSLPTTTATSWSLVTCRRQVALDWLLAELAEMDDGAPRSAWSVSRHVILRETWSPLGRGANATEAPPRPVRCAYWDVHTIWASLCDAHAAYEQTHGVLHGTSTCLVAVLEEFYHAWCAADQQVELPLWEGDEDGDRATQARTRDFPSPASLHDLTLACPSEDRISREARLWRGTTAPADTAHIVPVTLCQDVLSALLSHRQPAALVATTEIPLSFLLGLLDVCVKATMAHDAATAEEVDDQCACLAALRLIAMLRSLYAAPESTKATKHQTDNTKTVSDGVRAEQVLTRLDVLARLASELRALCGDCSGRAASFLTTASPAFWAALPHSWLDDTVPLHAVLLYTLLTERAAVEDVFLIVQRADAHVGACVVKSDNAFDHEARLMHQTLQASSVRLASVL